MRSRECWITSITRKVELRFLRAIQISRAMIYRQPKTKCSTICNRYSTLWSSWTTGSSSRKLSSRTLQRTLKISWKGLRNSSARSSWEGRRRCQLTTSLNSASSVRISCRTCIRTCPWRRPTKTWLTATRSCRRWTITMMGTWTIRRSGWCRKRTRSQASCINQSRMIVTRKVGLTTSCKARSPMSHRKIRSRCTRKTT